MSTRVLIAEDERKLAELLADYLRAADMEPVIVSDGAKVIAAVAEHQPDLLLLDLMLPQRDGLSICRELRSSGDLPIIMLTARSEEVDRLLGLELGADDYITKPFSPREVIARIKAVVRRSASPAAPAGDTTALEIDAQRMRATCNGQRLDLTPVEFKLLAVLVRHPGRVYRRDELLDLIYDDFRDISDRTVDSHIKNLRRKLAQAAPDKALVRSVYGIGYQLELD